MELMNVRPRANNLSRFFDDFLTKDLFDWTNNHFSTTNTTVPSVNILETKDDFLVEMAAPGMTKDDFQIELKDNVLTIRSERNAERELNEHTRYSRREFSYQSFERSFLLNKEVADDSNIQAKYENGLLRLVIPKTEEAKAKAPRKIEIK